MGVLAVMRRAHFEGRTICQPLEPSRTSITEMPWAFCAFNTFSASPYCPITISIWPNMRGKMSGSLYGPEGDMGTGG